jgi:gamma-glutamyltranspeptidase/glutathione hydrolase
LEESVITLRSALTLALAVVLVASARTRAAGTGAVEAFHGAVVSVSALGSEVGLTVLRKGGNAVDAAVATGFALAVTYPAAGNLGGGGFMVVYPGNGAKPAVIEYRETAPAAATKGMYAVGDSWYGAKVVGVPGTVRGLALAHRRFGKLAWRQLVMPAVGLAEDGFIIDEILAASLNSILTSSPGFAELCRILGHRMALAAGMRGTGWSRKNWRERYGSSLTKGRTPSTRGRSPTRLSTK